MDKKFHKILEINNIKPPLNLKSVVAEIYNSWKTKKLAKTEIIL